MLTMQVPPSASGNKISDGSRIDPIIPSKLCMAHFFSFISFENFNRLALGKFCFPASSLLGHILNVVNMRSQKQMIRIAAQFIVAPVKNIKTALHWSVFNFPRNPVRQFNSAMTQHAVPMSSHTANPIPALVLISRFNLLPKTILKSLCVFIHDSLTHQPVRLWCSFIHRIYSCIFNIRKVEAIVC